MNAVDERKEICYGFDGNIILSDEKIVYAKHIIGTKEDAFMCLFDSTGNLLNPAVGDAPKGHNKHRFKLKKVKEGCFQLYLAFLKSKSTAVFNNANRVSIE